MATFISVAKLLADDEGHTLSPTMRMLVADVNDTVEIANLISDVDKLLSKLVTALVSEGAMHEMNQEEAVAWAKANMAMEAETGVSVPLATKEAGEDTKFHELADQMKFPADYTGAVPNKVVDTTSIYGGVTKKEEEE